LTDFSSVDSIFDGSTGILNMCFISVSCDAVESRATKTGNLISISTAHHRVGNAAVFHFHAASHLMSVSFLQCDLYCFSILLCEY